MAWFPNLQNLGSFVNICNLWMLIKQDVIVLVKIARTNVSMYFSSWVSEAKFSLCLFLSTSVYISISVSLSFCLSLSLSISHQHTQTRTQTFFKKIKDLSEECGYPDLLACSLVKNDSERRACPKGNEWFFFLSLVFHLMSLNIITDTLIYGNIYLF